MRNSIANEGEGISQWGIMMIIEDYHHEHELAFWKGSDQNDHKTVETRLIDRGQKDGKSAKRLEPGAVREPDK